MHGSDDDLEATPKLKRKRSALNVLLKPFASSSSSKQPAFPDAVETLSDQPKTLRAARSHAVLRSPRDDHGLEVDTLARPLRRIESSPLLTRVKAPAPLELAPSRFDARRTPSTASSKRRAAAGSQGDVFGQILGWSTPPVQLSGTPAKQHPLARSTRTRAREDETKEYLETTDLPPDLIKELSLQKQSPFGKSVCLRSYHRRHDASSSSTTPARTMREMPSSESIKTERDQGERVRGPVKRFANPAIFDLLQDLEKKTTTDGGGPVTNAARLPSSGSLASQASQNSHPDAHVITVALGPGDDPRFIVWGQASSKAEKHAPTASSPIACSMSSLSADHIVMDSPVSEHSPALSGSSQFSANHSVTTTATSVRDSLASSASLLGKPDRRFVMAATIERLVAELTSQIESELLTTFFLCFRTFMRPVDLLTLLTTRFRWALAPASSPEDEAGRRIVRVRTFVAIRYWIMNHFEDDFVPDKELRSRLADWLNSSSKLPELISSPKDMRLIKSLKRLVKRIKVAHLAVQSDQAEKVARRLEKQSQKGDGKVLSKRDWSDEEVELDNVIFGQTATSGIAAGPVSTRVPKSAPLSAISKVKKVWSKRSSVLLSIRPDAKRRAHQAVDSENVLSSKNNLESYLDYYDIHKPNENGLAPVIRVDEPAVDDSTKIAPPPVGMFSEASPTRELFAPTVLSPVDSSSTIDIDNIDSSDEDDDDDEDIKAVSKTLRRLPGRDDLRVVPAPVPSFRSSVMTDSSFGEVLTSDRKSVVSFLSETDFDAAAVVPNFVLEGLDASDDEDEPGDVEAALRRLEGIVDDSKERRKADRVARQMQKSKEVELARAAAPAEVAEPPSDTRSVISYSSSLSDAPAPESQGQPSPVTIDITPASPARRKEPESPRRDQQTAASTVDAQPLKPSAPVTKGIVRKSSFAKLLSLARPLSLKPAPAVRPPQHRSFLLGCRTDTIVKQLCLIERDLLATVDWRELVDGAWHDSDASGDVLDWEEYVKERRRHDVAAKQSQSPTRSNVAAIAARFNVTANWVCSELVLTRNLEARRKLLAKFVRLAFKCYLHANYQTMAQIVYALMTPDIARLHKTWSALSKSERRQFEGLKRFVSPDNNFKHMREATQAVVAKLEAEDPVLSPSESSFKKNKGYFSGCIPFFGLFLHDLSMNDELPTFLDPSTHGPANVDADGELVSVDSPDAFASLPDLPPQERLRPLVNVHKMRVASSTVQSVLACQRLAKRYPFEAERQEYFACLKLKCLPPVIIHECSKQIEP